MRTRAHGGVEGMYVQSTRNTHLHTVKGPLDGCLGLSGLNEQPRCKGGLAPAVSTPERETQEERPGRQA